MAKCEAKSARVACGSRIGSLIVTNAAGCNFSARLRFAGRSVAGVTLVMSRDTPGNSKRCCAPTDSAVAGGTSALRPGSSSHVLSVIKLDVEALIELRGKTFQRRV